MGPVDAVIIEMPLVDHHVAAVDHDLSVVGHLDAAYLSVLARKKRTQANTDFDIPRR
eukprot:CAMPEP_0181497834 /NCGR_PEP_ID=MMETSP1110-20121109/53756_1 /TAXON_ID=174948 /ORGANISM="Symbiodinium sp., Strain CCMP421" /LENGTH=56 /DNA_ID=CAMNT_0023625819 /DNA_START=134 /DNA_END=301 /DNA_ORIENTATION=-